MTTWTPKLEQAIRALGDFMEAQAKDVYDPSLSVEQTLTSLTDRFNNVGKKAYQTAVSEALSAGLILGGPLLADLVLIARMNRSDAADKIVKALKMEAELRAKYPEMKDTARHTKLETAQVLPIAKKSGLHW